MSTPSASAARFSTGAVKAPSATVRRSASRSAGRAPSPMPLPRLKLRELVDEQVRTRSPSPARPGQRLGPRALGEAEAGHLGEAARDQGGAGILAEPAPLDHAAGDGEHVLDRAADLGAGDVVGEIGPEIGPGDARDQPLAERLVLDRQRHRGRQAGRHFMGEGRPGKDRDRRSPAAPRGRPRASSRPVPSSIPLAQRTSGFPAAVNPPITKRKCWAGLTIRKASQPPRSARSPVARIDAG